MIGKLTSGGATITDNVVYGKFPAPADNQPSWIKSAVKKHRGLSVKLAGKNLYLEGVDVTLPNGKKIPGEGGYLRTTGQWREDVAHGYDVEVFCCKTLKTGWVPARLLIGVRLVDNL